MVQRIPRVPAPIKKSAASCFTDSPFDDKIALAEMSKKFSFPNMKLYDGTTDPDDHIAQYRQRMFTAAILRDLREACMCKGFDFSLMGPAQQCLQAAEKLEKMSDDIYHVVQRRSELLREFVGRFNREKVSIPSCNQQTAISAFRKGAPT
ncbi:Retrotrans gag domain-containing protein [Abeliophyllum distichum]|uniref:Retrotrans gag domain-containing protein n=1 Tax=Abeliophyllum distichum TaxID=126358 RepID=A0ABD1PSV9_9LAMI